MVDPGEHRHIRTDGLFGVDHQGSLVDRWLGAARRIREFSSGEEMTLFLAGFLSGVFALWLLLELLSRKHTAPTKHNREPKRYVYNDQSLNRKYRDAPGRREPAEPDQPFYMYGVTGLEDEK
jgi:hypothetical protein